MSWLYAPIYLGLFIICITQSFYPIFMVSAMLVRQSKLLYSFFHTVDKTSKKHGGDIVAQVLSHHGIERIFTLPGGHVSPIAVSSDRLGIHVVDVRHEATAVFAADATARLTGIPGVAVVTAGPGLTNTVTAIKNAQMAESPVVVIAGAAATMLRGRGSLQDIDQLSLLRTATKKCMTVDCVRDIAPTLREAFRVAQVDTPGPVLVEMPVDVLYPYSIIAGQFNSMSSKRPASLKVRVLQAYTNYFLQNIFADATKPQLYDQIPVSVRGPNKSQVRETISLLKSAKRPLLIIGSQALLPPCQPDALFDMVNELGIPVYLNGAARGMLGANHKLQYRHARKEAVKEADCVILLGAICDFRLSYGSIFKRGTKVVAVNRDIKQAKLNSGLFWQPALTLESDISKFLGELKGKVEVKLDSEWVETLNKRDADKDANIAKMALEPCDEYINPLKLLLHLRDTFPADNKVLIADGGDFVGTASYIMKPSGPRRWLDPGPFGTLGCAAGFALAAGLHDPNASVVAIMGDGAFGYAIPELDTLVRHKVPVYWIIGNDACWTQIEREQVPMLGSAVGCKLAYTDYHKVSQGFGALGYKLDKDEDLALLKSAKDEMEKTGLPVVVNALIGKTKFREGSISV